MVKLSGLTTETLTRVFNFFLNDNYISRKDGSMNLFRSRKIPYNNNPNNADLGKNQIANHEFYFKNSLAKLYINTFFDLDYSVFKTMRYKEEVSRLDIIIENSKNPQKFVKTVLDYAKSKNFDYRKLLSHPQMKDVLYPTLTLDGLSTNKPSRIMFISPKFVPEARIYVNPSMSGYSQLLTYIYKKVSENELSIGVKTRLNNITENGPLDNLVIYTDNKSLPQMLEILEDFGTRYPKIVSEFGSPIATHAHSEQGWYGVGFEFQRCRAYSNMTFNDFIDCCFNSYILPIIILENYDEITKNIDKDSIYSIFLTITKDTRLARKIAYALDNPELRAEFLSDYSNLSYMETTSEKYNNDNKKLSAMSRDYFSVAQYRQHKGNSKQFNDAELIALENIKLPCEDGRTIQLTRNAFSNILKSPLLRQALKTKYSTKSSQTTIARRMLNLFNSIGKASSYTDSKNPLLSCGMVESLKASEKPITMNGVDVSKFFNNKKDMTEHHSKYIDMVSTVCGNKVVITAELIQYGYTAKELHTLKLHEIQRLLIMSYSLDEFVKAHEYVRTLPESETGKLSFNYENTLKTMRRNRGKEMSKRLNSLKTKNEKDAFIASLSEIRREDLANFTLSMERLNQNAKTAIKLLEKIEQENKD